MTLEQIKKAFNGSALTNAEAAVVAQDVELIENIQRGEIESAAVSIRALYAVLWTVIDPAVREACDLDYESNFYLEARDGVIERPFTIDKWGIDFDTFDYGWKLDYGCEGIYLTAWLARTVRYEDGEKKKIYYDLLTAKTLRDDDDAFRKMAMLGAEYQLAVYKFPKAN